MLSGVVGATPTFQEFNIMPMSVAWIQWAWKLIYNPNIFFFLESSASDANWPQVDALAHVTVAQDATRTCSR